MAKRLLSTQIIVNLSSDPISATAGEVYYNTSINSLKYYDGSQWSVIGSGSGGTATKVFYQTSEPSSPVVGDIWVDSDETSSSLNSNDFALTDSPTFTGTVILPSTTSIGNVSSSELSYLDGVTSNIQTQLDSKADSSEIVYLDGVTSNVQTQLDSKVDSIVSINSQTETSYTLVIEDADKLIEMNNAAPNTLTVPPNSSVVFPVGTKIDIAQMGAGQTTVAAGSGVTINSVDQMLSIGDQYGAATLIKRAADTWILIGNLA